MHAPVGTASLDITPCLLRAIEEHKYVAACASCSEVDFLEAAREFRANHEKEWRAAKIRADNAQQAQEMRKHLWIESQKAGRDLGRTAAGTDWVTRYAAPWRRQRESLHANGFLELCVTSAGRATVGLGLRELVDSVSALYADVFVSQEGVDRPHFRLEQEPGAPKVPFLVFRSGRQEDLSQLRLQPGQSLRFVAYGRDAERALATIREALA